MKSELFKSGIRSEVRTNPVAAALRVSRFELWVENESDHFKASKVYARMQARGNNGKNSEGADPAETGAETYIDIEELSPQSSEPGSSRARRPGAEGDDNAPRGELEQASLLLQKEIEELLERDNELNVTCESLQSKVEELAQALADAQAMAEKQAAEFGAAKASLEQQLAERTTEEEKLRGELREVQGRLKSVEQALAEKHRKHEATLQQLQSQQAAVVELRKEIVSREQEFEEARRAAAKAHAEAEVERNTRAAAEERALGAVAAAKQLENRLAEQKKLELDMQAYLSSVNSLRNKLLSKKPATRVIAS